jgi:hypothetical protein
MTTISHQTSRGRASSRYNSPDRDDYYGGIYPSKSAQKVVVVARSRSRSLSIDRVRGRSRSIDRIVVTKRSPVRHRSVSRVVVRQRYPSRHTVLVQKRRPSIDRVVVRRRGSSVDALVVGSRSVRTSSPYRSYSSHRPGGTVKAVTTTTRYATDSLYPTHHHGNRHYHHQSGSSDLKVIHVDNDSASYTRVHVDRICPETLRYFNVPWEWESVRDFLPAPLHEDH